MYSYMQYIWICGLIKASFKWLLTSQLPVYYNLKPFVIFCFLQLLQYVLVHHHTELLKAVGEYELHYILATYHQVQLKCKYLLPIWQLLILVSVFNGINIYFPHSCIEDYRSGPYTAIFSGHTSASFDINITNDNVVESNEYFILWINPLTLPVGSTIGYPSQARVTITNDDCK